MTTDTSTPNELQSAEQTQQKASELGGEEKTADETLQATKLELKQTERNLRRIAKQRDQLQKDVRTKDDRINSLKGQSKQLADVVNTSRPVRDDYDTDEAYQDAFFEYNYAKKQAVSGNGQNPINHEVAGEGGEPKANSQPTSVVTNLSQDVVDAWQDKIFEAADRYTDFDAVTRASGLQINNEMAEAIMASDKGADIWYFLGKRPTIAAKINRMDSVEAVQELAKIEVLLKKQQTNVSQAPDPIIPLKGGDVLASDPSRLSTRDWIDARNKKEYG